jgi:hypothetical protein
MAITQRARRKPRRVRLSAPTDASRSSETIRWSKVIAAQTRIASGHYDREAVRSRLVEAVMRALKDA